jgi:hypothetical protein
MQPPDWPESDVRAFNSRAGGIPYYKGAVVCRRGHVEAWNVGPGNTMMGFPERCPTCGANVLAGCPHCNWRIRGGYVIPAVPFVDEYIRPSFCDRCGAAYPWATREERIYELENLLDEEDIDDADRVVVSDNLRRLREEKTLSEKEQRATWERIKASAGSALRSPHVAAVVEGLVSAAIRAQLGI